MMKLFLLLLLVFVSCTPDTKVTDAERLFDTDYDSACIVIRSINPEKLISQKSKAIYALSLTRADFYNGTAHTNDSLISIATGFFDRKDPRRASLAWYYKARTDALTQNYDEQIQSLLKSQDYALKSKNEKLLAYIYYDKAVLFHNQHKNDSALSNYLQAEYYYSKFGDNYNALNSRIQTAHMNLLLKKTEPAEKNCIQLLENEKTLPVELASTVYRILGALYFVKGENELSVQYYRKTPLTNHKSYDENISLLTAQSLIAGKQYDSARLYLSKISEPAVFGPDYFKLWKEIYVYEGNFREAANCAEKAYLSADSIYRNRIDESFAGLEKRYNYQKLELNNKDLEIRNMRSNLLVLLSFFIIAAITAVFIIYRSRSRVTQLKTERELLRQQNIRAEKEAENARLFEKQLVLQKIVISNLEQYRTNAHKRPENIKEGFSPVKNEHFYHELFTAIDLEYNDFSKRLREKFSQLSDNDVLICCLLLAGFDTGMMASILDIKIDSMNMKRSRLRKKLNIDNSVNLTEYLRNF